MSNLELVQRARMVSTGGVRRFGLSVAEGISVPHLFFLWKCTERHLRGDWGDVCAEDKATNDAALDSGERIISAYDIPPDLQSLADDTQIWIVTDAVGADGKRAYTTIMLRNEY